jgi:hypothetical protein
MSESKMWGSYSKLLPGEYQRFEDKYSPGIPDVSWAYNGKEIWIENKYLKELINEKTKRKIGLRPEQGTWLTKRKKQGSNVFVLLKCGSGRQPQWWLFDDNFFILVRESHTAEDLLKYCRTMWYGKFSWETVWKLSK